MTIEAKKQVLKQEIENGTADIFQLIPKDREFDYSSWEKAKRFMMLQTEEPMTYENLVHKLVVPQAHVGRDSQLVESNAQVEMSWGLDDTGKWTDCFCPQFGSCRNLREVYHLVEIIKTKLGEIEHPTMGKIFNELEMTLIGSMKEGTKIFKNDELDIHFSLRSSFLNNTYFDQVSQTLFVNNQTFPCKDFISFYLWSLYDILKNLKLPESFSMLPLNTSYTPCTKCMKIVYGHTQVNRCHHKSDCIVHSNNDCKDLEDCPYECDCKSFGTPSIAWTKIGAVLHLGKKLRIMPTNTLCRIFTYQ